MSAKENCVLPLNKFGNSEKTAIIFLMEYKIVACVKEGCLIFINVTQNTS